MANDGKRGGGGAAAARVEAPGNGILALLGGVVALVAAGCAIANAGGFWLWIGLGVVAAVLVAAGVWRTMPIARSRYETSALAFVGGGGLLLLVPVLLVVTHQDTPWTTWVCFACLVAATALIGVGASRLKLASGA